MRANGVELTAYLVNESRARRPELARDPLARDWIPAADRDAVHDLWEEYAGVVYPHDDLVVSLRGRCIHDALAQTVRDKPDTVLLTCGAGFASYPWLLPFPAAVEVDLPEMVAAKQQRAADLLSAKVIDDRDVRFVAADLNDAADRQRVADYVQELAGGRPVAFLAEGLIFYLSRSAARAVAGLGMTLPTHCFTAVSYWPQVAADNKVLAAQRTWFRSRSVPEEATYLEHRTVRELLEDGEGDEPSDLSPEELQRRYLGEIQVPETELIPEYVAMVRA